MGKDIFQKIETANKPDFGEILSKSFELFKKLWQDALYHALITLAVVIPFIIIVYGPMIAFLNYYEAYDPYGYYEPVQPPIALMIIFFVVILILSFVLQAFSLGIIAHFFRVLKKEDMGSSEDVGGYFVYFKGKYFSKLILLSLASFGIAMTAVLLCYLPLFYVLVPLHLLQVIFAFNDELSVSDIIKASFKLGNKFWLIIFGLIIISSMIAQIGIILCFVGMFFTAFFAYVPIYFLYKDTVGFDDVPEKNIQKF